MVVLAHGAGGHKDHPHLLALDSLLSELGLEVHRFNFPYREQGRKFPDKMSELVASYRQVAEEIRARLKPKLLILAGHSLGARTATMLASEGFACQGLILFSYPLHPPGKPEKIRRDHLIKIKVPVLSLSGTRDTFCTPDLLKETLKPLAKFWHHHALEGADHGLQVLKSSGKTNADILVDVGNVCQLWLNKLQPSLQL
jgi:uncharacterized protein